MILQTMLQRLYASLASGPGLNARPHRSRQRIDLTELQHFQHTDPQQALTTLLGPPARSLEFAAKVPPPPVTDATAGGETDPAVRQASQAWDRQQRLLRKLRGIAQDATDYYQDHGDHSLYIGFPLLSVPVTGDRAGSRTRRLLAPALLLPVHLQVRTGPRTGITLQPAGEGADLLIANPALMAWIEQQTGRDTDDLFADEDGEEPWREVAEVLALASKALGVAENAQPFDRDHCQLQPVPLMADLPNEPTLIPGAVLGLFPSANPGLVRDTQWMIENEAGLQAPVRGFLKMQALTEPAAPQPAEDAEPAASAVAGADQEWLVTRADPCQAEAVVKARSSEALVIHGPPGTGKSQTIANIIGDHLARGERVLFVCDKRTALDVVQFRLQGMGLGKLCGVIHDPQRDRRDFYMGLRERLEQLTQDQPATDPNAELRVHNERMKQLRDELHGYHQRLHQPGGDGQPAYHDLCGRWLELQIHPDIGSTRLDVGNLTLADIDRHQADAEEVLNRAGGVNWPANPLRGQVKPALNQWFAGQRDAVGAALTKIRGTATALDECQDTLGPIDFAVPPLEQATACERAAALLREIGAAGATVAQRLIQDERADHWRRECDSLADEAARISEPLESELRLNHDLRTHPPTPARLTEHLATIDHWQGLNGFQRMLYFGARKAVRNALAEIGIKQPTPATLERSAGYFRGVRARVLWTDLQRRLTGHKTTATDAPLLDDDELLSFGRAVPLALELGKLMQQPGAAAWRAGVIATLTGTPDEVAVESVTGDLLQRAQRARALHDLRTELDACGLLTTSGLQHWCARWGAGQPAVADIDSMIAVLPAVETLIRIEERLAEVPPALALVLRQAADAGLDWASAGKVAGFNVLNSLLRNRLLTDPELARIDTQRIEAAFDELQQRINSKQDLVRSAILHRWDQLWRARLLAATGSRLNPVGANLRQRLFIRGKRALKLRQMIAAGDGHPEGDPLFDLCPVWMASPATVAQIFARAPQFDSIIFDEASQCRLEEALPTLLRARRVVIAGDPQQLPPTRFFESALADSDDTEAETAEELFEAQQAGVEDLLAAALNLNVDQAFLDVHYRSRDPALIEFSNHAFYRSRLQSVPGHPSRLGRTAPIRLVRVNGTYRDRTNPDEAKAAAGLVATLLDQENPPSIGIASFNLTQRECILDALDQLAAADHVFAERLEQARQRQGEDSFEGLFVKNLENVQGDQRDHMIISTTFGPDDEGRFRRNFGALSQRGGERRLNVLITRAREAIHLLTSIPESEYLTAMPAVAGDNVSGRHYLFDYLRFAAGLQRNLDERALTDGQSTVHGIRKNPTESPSPFAEALAGWLQHSAQLDETLYWGNDGFCVDLVLPRVPGQDDISPAQPLGLLTDFNRYRKTPDPIAWENFRTAILRGQGWRLHRLWSPALFRDSGRGLQQALGTPAMPALLIAPIAGEAMLPVLQESLPILGGELGGF